MLGALIIVFREVIEAGLIVGIVMAVTKGMHGQPRRWSRSAWSAGSSAQSGGGLRGRPRRIVGWHRAGSLQRRHPAARRRDAHLAQRLDGQPRPRARRRGQPGRRRGALGRAPDLCARRRRRRRRDAGGLGGRAVPLRPRRLGQYHVAGISWSARCSGSSRLRGHRRHLSRPGDDPDAPAVRGDDDVDHSSSRPASRRRRSCSCSRRAY